MKRLKFLIPAVVIIALLIVSYFAESSFIHMTPVWHALVVSFLMPILGYFLCRAFFSREKVFNLVLAFTAGVFFQAIGADFMFYRIGFAIFGLGVVFLGRRFCCCKTCKS